ALRGWGPWRPAHRSAAAGSIGPARGCSPGRPSLPGQRVVPSSVSGKGKPGRGAGRSMVEKLGLLANGCPTGNAATTRPGPRRGRVRAIHAFSLTLGPARTYMMQAGRAGGAHGRNDLSAW